MSVRVRSTDQTQALLYHARAATPFRSEGGEPCVSIPSTIDSRRVVPLRSAAFRDWLTANFYSEYEAAPSSSAFRAALRTLEACAEYGDFPAQKVDRRLSFEGDPFLPKRILLDLANPAGEMVEITSRDWEIRGNFGHSFLHSPDALPLPRPDRSAAANKRSLGALCELLRLSDTSRVRALTWLAGATRPVGPYPILVLRGPAGSGKSVLARTLRAMLDPSTAPTRRFPARDRELLQLAMQSWILAFDHVHRIAPKVSDALCAISSGDALEVAQTGGRDPLVYQVARPVILIAPNDDTQPAWTPSPTLSKRTLTIDLKPITALRPESAIWSDFEALRPGLVAVLASTVSTALRRIREIDLGNVDRFPDCAAWAAAAAPALGLDENRIVQTFTDPDAMWIGSDPLREAIHAILQQSPIWSGEATALLSQLRASAPLAVFPSSPKSLSQALSRVPGIQVMRTKSPKGGRVLTITKTPAATLRTALSERSDL